MDTRALVEKRISHYYRVEDLNCAISTLKILGEKFDIEIAPQVLESAIGMNGAGLAQAQCGLVEGTLMFLGILGRNRGWSDDDVMDACRDYAAGFEKRFGSLSCRVLRPEGFAEDNPPQLCEPLSVDAVCFDIEFIEDLLRK